ncbi:MAG: isopentenyl phosphate kinase [Candidatus Methanosuratincola sp.]|uniref:Isopentenyl phosphate kinase n=2 Tax=Candidatus Methanosuratincola (ex Vanwonterghem et al. 2016) TaxID=1915412 RepID=A0A7J3UYE8_9CREN|nr:isopentenyl phosphate kinase [Candidatus Methanosuratincola sp.]RWX73554.1 MAG: Isopentenyl phosphate kinase [Candidatus Methanosuratincola subterraneus]
MKADLVIKLGGSAITQKDTPYAPKLDVIDRIAEEFAHSWKGVRVLLVHGGGSFGHRAAMKYIDGSGRLKDPRGIAETRHAMHRLTSLLAESFLGKGVPFFAVDPSACFFEESDMEPRLGYSLKPVELALSAGLLPSLGGDVVLSSQGHGRILSGDTIARILALASSAGLLAFGTDVDGYLEDGKPLRRIDRGKLKEIIASTKARANDVTGGMAGKLGEVGEYLSSGGNRALIFNATRPGAIASLLRGEEVEGTYID